MLSVRALSKSRALSLRAVHNNVRQSLSPAHYTSRIVSAAHNNRFSEALDIAASMKRDGVQPDKRTYDSLLSCAAAHNSWLFAWAIFDDMIACGIQPTASSFLPLLQAQAFRPFLNQWAALDKMKEYDVQPSSAMYTTIIQSQADVHNIEPALKTYLQMRRENVPLELSAAETLVNLLCQGGYSRLAFEVATNYEAESIRSIPDHIWSEVLACAAKNLHYDITKKAWDRVFHELEVKVTEYTSLAVLNTAARHNDAALATEALEALRDLGVAWREHHFAGVIQALCGSNKFKEAFVTLKLMRDEGLVPTGDSYTTISNAVCSSVENLDAAWQALDQVWSEMPTHLDITALKAVMKASITLGDLQRAVAIYKGFDDYSITRDVPTYNMLIEAAIGASHRRLGDLIMEDMKQAKAKPDIETYEKIIQLCLTQDTYEDAFFYLEEMKAAGHIPPQSIYEAILAKCTSVKDPRSAMVVQEMEECGYKPTDPRSKLVANKFKRAKQNPPHRNQQNPARQSTPKEV